MAQQSTTDSFESHPLDPRYRKCGSCGLIAPVGRHGMVDCVEEFRRQIKNLRREKIAAEVRADMAEETLASLHAAFKVAFDD